MSRGRVVIAVEVLLLVVAAGLSFAQDAKPWEKPGTKVGEQIIGPDGGKMVWVPAGEFTMGSPEGEGFDQEHPAHRVRITKGFWIAKCTVTNAQYRRYCQEEAELDLVHFPKNSDQGDNHPAVCVNWADVQAYCDHYGLSLPTEAQWEYAARGPEGRQYPWGNEWDPKKCCNGDNKGPGGETFPVGSFPKGASWCGALDMAGNVWQWCKDWYSEAYYANSPDTDPPGPDTGEWRVLRGGSWVSDLPRYFRCAFRDGSPPTNRSDLGFGFRCVRGL